MALGVLGASTEEYQIVSEALITTLVGFALGYLTCLGGYILDRARSRRTATRPSRIDPARSKRLANTDDPSSTTSRPSISVNAPAVD